MITGTFSWWQAVAAFAITFIAATGAYFWWENRGKRQEKKRKEMPWKN